MKLPEWAKWLARDKSGTLNAYKEPPEKGKYWWGFDLKDGEFEAIRETDDRYKNIKWEDEEPTEVKSVGCGKINLPEWANWLARDKGGELYAYSVKPLKADGYWNLKNLGDNWIGIEETDDSFSHIKWTDEEPTKIKRGLEAGGVSVEELNSIINAKAHGYDEVPEIETEPNHEGWSCENKGSLEEKLLELGKAYAPFLEKAGKKAEDAFRKYESVPELADKAERAHVDKDGDETTIMSFEEVMALVENDMINQPLHYVGNQGLEVEVVLQNFIPRYEDPYVGHRIASAIEYLLRSPLKNQRQDIEKAGKNIQQALAYLDMMEEEK